MFGAFNHLPESLLVPTARTAGPDEGIQQLAFLVGGVWVARTNGQVTEERCAWWLDDSAIATDVVSRQDGKVVSTARGLFVWDPVGEALLSMAASSSGVLVFSRQTGGTDRPPSWIFDARYEGTMEQRRRITMSHPSEDELVIAQALRDEDGSYRPLGEATYYREVG